MNNNPEVRNAIIQFLYRVQNEVQGIQILFCNIS